MDGTDYIEHAADDATNDQLPRKTVPVISTTPTKADKVARYIVIYIYIYILGSAYIYIMQQ